MAAGSASSETIERQRTKLLQILQQDPDSVLDMLMSQRAISEKEYEALKKVTDPLKKSQMLLTLVQKKGEASSGSFLQSLCNTITQSATTLDSKLVLELETVASQSIDVSKNSEDTFSLGKKPPKFSEEKEFLDLQPSHFFKGKEGSYREVSLPSRENEKEVTMQYSAERVQYEIPATIKYLKDGERYEKPDDSLYLGQEEYQQSVGYPDDVETTVEEGACEVDDEYDDEEEESEYSETTGYSSEENSYEDSEASISLEEEEKRMEERKKTFQRILACLNLDRSRKLLPNFIKQFSLDRGCAGKPETPGDLAWNFLMKVQSLDVTARDFILQHKVLDEEEKEELLTRMGNLEIGDIQTINPLDVLCACMLCSDSSLRREVMSNMYRCQFALPLLLPDAENNRSILMLGAMKDVKEQCTQSSGGPFRDKDKFLSLMKMPVISFVRLGHCSFSKTRILNTLLSSTQGKSHKIFLHKDLSLPVLPRQISDGLLEITWCFPDSDELKENPHFFQKPIAVANLRGDLESFWTQFGFVVEISSGMFFFTDHLSEKEWDLLLFLGEDVIERCYFVLSPQAKESEEAQIFQRTLKLRPSHLLFWEREEAGDRRNNLEALQAALQEVMSSSLRCVSIEDMASLARELGIQVDQDFERTQGIQVSPGTAEDENQQRHSWTADASESRAQMPAKEPGAQCEGSQNAQHFHQTPGSMRHLAHPWPFPISNFYSVSLKAPWVMGSHFWSVPRAKWFCPLPLQNTQVHSTNKIFGPQYFQPQRFYSDERLLKFSRNSWGHHLNGAFGISQRPTSQHKQTCPKGLQTAPQRSGTVVPHVGLLHSLGSQPARAVEKPQPGNAQAPGTQLTEVTGKAMIKSRIKHPYPQSFQLAGSIQKKPIPTFHERAQLLHERPSDPAFQPRSQSMSESKLSHTPQFNSYQPKLQVKHFQQKPFHSVLCEAKSPHPQASQAKPSPSKPTHPQPYQAKPSPSKPTHPQPYQAKPSSSKPTHPQPYQAKPSPSKPTHPRPYQAKPSSSKPTHPQPYQAKSSSSKPTHPQPYQANPSSSKPTHSQASQAKPSPSKPTHPQPYQAKPSPSKPTYPQPFQAKPSPSKPTHPQPSQAKLTQPQSHGPHQPQSKLSQARPTQPKSSQPKPSQAKAYYARAGPKRTGKH